MATDRSINAQIDKLVRQQNPRGKSRKVAIVGANPVLPTVSDKTKKLPEFPYLVQIQSPDGDWFTDAAFRLLWRAEEYARWFHKKNSKSTVRVLSRD